MTIAPMQVTQIDTTLVFAKADAQTIATLRKLTPGLTITRVDALDMRDEAPFRVYEKISLFLIDGREHCWKITQDPECATGIALAPNGADT